MLQWVVAETEENVNIGFHCLELEGRPLTDVVGGKGREKGGWWWRCGIRVFPIPVRVLLNKPGRRSVREGEPEDKRQSEHSPATLGQPDPLNIIAELSRSKGRRILATQLGSGGAGRTEEGEKSPSSTHG